MTGVLAPEWAADTGEATLLLLLRGILRGAISYQSATGDTLGARPVAPFHSGLSVATWLFNFRNLSPIEVCGAGPAEMIVSDPKGVP